MSQLLLDYYNIKGDSSGKEDSNVEVMINSSDSGLETPPNSLPINADQASGTEVIDVELYTLNNQKDVGSIDGDASFSTVDSPTRKRKNDKLDDASIAKTHKILKTSNERQDDYCEDNINNINYKSGNIETKYVDKHLHSNCKEVILSSSHDTAIKSKVRTKRAGKGSSSMKEQNKMKAELEKKQRDIRKKKLEAEKELKKKKLEEERELKKKRIEEEKELKRKRIAAEKELKRKKLEEEKEQRKKKLESEKIERELKKRKLEEEKELKKRKIEAEKLQKKRLEESKQRSQSKISSFFSVQKKVGGSSIKKTDYKSTFLNFNLKESCYLLTRNVLDENQLRESIKLFDESILKKSNEKYDTVESWLRHNEANSNNSGIRRGFKLIKTAEDVVNSINGDSLDENEIVQLLQELPIKYLQFYENVRPAYCGTYTKQDKNSVNIAETGAEPVVESGATASYDRIICKSPFFKLPNVDYSYDSDVEWNAEDDEDGGEIDDLDDEDDDDDDGFSGSNDENNSDLDGFVDDENDLISMNINKKIMIGKLIPIVKTFNSSSTAIKEIKMDTSMMASMVVPNLEFPVDPFKNYWSSVDTNLDLESKPAFNTITANAESLNKKCSDLSNPVSSDKIQSGSENTTAVQRNNIVSNERNIMTQKVTNILTARKKTKTVITNEEELKKFIKFVNDNNDFTTSTLVEILKKRFSAYTKIIVKNTLEQVACKKGPKATEKIWVINDEFSDFLKSSQ